MNGSASGISDIGSGISTTDRRWAILQWLSVKLPEAPPNLILETSLAFEAFVIGDVAGQKDPSVAEASIRKLDPGAGPRIELAT